MTHLDKIGTIDFIDDSGTLNLRVHPSETGRLVCQIGSSNIESAYKAACAVNQWLIKVQDDVAGIDLNCGCPKSFSVSGGMGSALLETPELLTGVF